MNRVLSSIALSTEGLAWFRQGLGLLCVLDAAFRLPGVSFFLSDLGVLPRSHYYTFYQESYAWSVFLVSGRPEVSGLLLLVTIGLGLLQCFRRDSRGSRAVLWVLILSVQNRHPGLLDSADDLLRMMLFWDIFLPESSSEEASDWVTPATVGLQIQLSLMLFFTAFAVSPESFSLASQWGGGLHSEDISNFYLLEKVVLWALILAVWWRPARLGLLLLALPVLVARGVLFHPVFPLTLALSLGCLARPPRRGVRLKVDGFWGQPGASRPVFLFLAIVVLGSIGLNVVTQPTLRAPLVSLGQGFGLLQDWDRVYPTAEDRLVGLVASVPGSERPFWAVTRASTRRERLFAQRVAQNAGWAAYLPRALGSEFGEAASNPMVWLQAEDLSPDFVLNGGEVFLLSRSPVNTNTRRRVSP